MPFMGTVLASKMSHFKLKTKQTRFHFFRSMTLFWASLNFTPLFFFWWLFTDQWLDQPINVPVDEYVPVQDGRICPVKGNTAQLLNEFNQVYDAVELTHLTPPETPPHSPPQATLQGYLNPSKVNAAHNYFCCNQEPMVNQLIWSFGIYRMSSSRSQM